MLAAATLALALPFAAVAHTDRHRHARAAAEGPAATLHVKLQPPRAGQSTVIHFAVHIAVADVAAPPALTHLDVTLPPGMGIDMSGLPSCSRRALRARGPRACPRGAQVGAGHLQALMPLGEVTRTERAALAIFKGPARHGRSTLLFSATGRVPIVVRLTFAATIDPRRRGATIAARIPLEPTLPGQPDAALIGMSSTIGAIDRNAGRRRHPPRGVTVPKRCPKPGLPFTAAFVFQDGAEAAAQTTVACRR